MRLFVPPIVAETPVARPVSVTCMSCTRALYLLYEHIHLSGPVGCARVVPMPRPNHVERRVRAGAATCYGRASGFVRPPVPRRPGQP
jgi:hypothetical protein